MVDHIGDAAKKADVIFMKIGRQLPERELQLMANKQREKYSNIQRIVFVYGDKIFSYVRP